MARGFRKWAVNAVYPPGSMGRKIAIPLSPTPTKAGGRWLTLSGWPKWRRGVLENGAVDAVYPPGITGAPRTALPLSTPHPMQVVDGSLLLGDQNDGGRF